EQIVEGQGEIAAGHAQRGERDVDWIDVAQGIDHLPDLDVAQMAKKRHAGERDDSDAQEKADPVPADRLVEKPRYGAHRLEGLAAIRVGRLHLDPLQGYAVKSSVPDH